MKFNNKVNINISGHHVTITEPIRKWVEKKISDKLNQFFNNIINIHVTLRVEKLEQKAEASVELAGGRGPLFASATSKDMYESIDSLASILEGQLKKHKQKLQSKY